VLDGRQPKITAQIKMAARNLQMRELFPDLQSMKASFGEVNGDAALTGHGNSVAAMLGSSNGEFATTVSQGTISRYILEEAGLNVANVLFVKLFGDKQVRLNCLVSEFGVNNGVAGVRRFVVDTDESVISITRCIRHCMPKEVSKIRMSALKKVRLCSVLRRRLHSAFWLRLPRLWRPSTWVGHRSLTVQLSRPKHY